MVISIDFDGVIVSNRYPSIGVLRNDTKETLDKWNNQGHTIVINTCRAGRYATEALQFLTENSIPFHYFNANPKQLIDKYGTDTRKISADIYFDDKNPKGFYGWEHAKDEVNNIQKPLVICIIGESGSGKTTWATYIERQYGIPMIQSYTDRPRRADNEEGHVFLEVSDFDLLKEEDMIAYTRFGDYRYCCLKQDVKQLNTYVIDEDGFDMLKQRYDDIYDIVSIRVSCDADELRNRVGEERANRDKGRFNMSDFDFDFKLYTNRDKEMTRGVVDRIVNEILSIYYSR